MNNETGISQDEVIGYIMRTSDVELTNKQVIAVVDAYSKFLAERKKALEKREAERPKIERLAKISAALSEKSGYTY